MKELYTVSILVIIFIFSLITYAWVSTDTIRSSNEVILPDKYILIDAKWERFNSENCFYDFHLYGFKSHNRDTDRVRSVIVLDHCDAYQINQKLLIQE